MRRPPTDPPPSNDAGPLTRRGLLRHAALGAGAAVVAPAWLADRARAAGQADALLLSCMDFRLMDEIEHYMAGRGLRDKYDHIVLAGASLGAVTDRYPAWNKVFWDHLGLAVSLHAVPKVIVMDHRDCGAYKVILSEDIAKDPVKEREFHARTLKQLAGLIQKRQPQLAVELLLMSLDGSVEEIT